MRIAVLLVLFAWSIPTLAQEDKNAEINKIKRSRDYLTVTGTSMVSAEEASENARMLIDVEIEQWLQGNAEGDIAGYVAKSKENLAVIETKRGSLFRAFIYVKKKDILPSLFRTHLVYVCSRLDHSAVSGILAGTLRVDVAVGVVKMQDHEILGLYRR